MAFNASPEKRLDLLAPFIASNPFPSDTRCSSRGASNNPVDTLNLLSFSFSTHLKAGIS